MEAGGLFSIGRDVCNAEGSDDCNLNSYHFKRRWKSDCVCALYVKVPKLNSNQHQIDLSVHVHLLSFASVSTTVGSNIKTVFLLIEQNLRCLL